MLGELLNVLGVESFSDVDPFTGVLESLRGRRAVSYFDSGFSVDGLLAEVQLNLQLGLGLSTPPLDQPLSRQVDLVTGMIEGFPVTENQQRSGLVLDALDQFGAGVALEAAMNFVTDLSGGQLIPGGLMRGSYPGNVFSVLGDSGSDFADFFGQLFSSLSGRGERASGVVFGPDLFG